MNKPMLTLSKAVAFTEGVPTRFPGAGSMLAQKRAQMDADSREVLALYSAMPREKLHPEGLFVDAYDVVKGLGMPYAEEVIWTRRVQSWTRTSPNELALRKALHDCMREDKLPSDVKGELARRALVFFRSKHEKLGLIQKAQGPQPKKRGAPRPEEPTGKPKMMEHSQPGKAPPSLADQPDPSADPNVDQAGIDEEPQDPQLLKDKLMRLADQLKTLEQHVAASRGHIHMHNEIKSVLRTLYKNPTPDGVREAEHQVAHFSALVQGAPEMEEPEDDEDEGPSGNPGEPGQPGGPAFRSPKDAGSAQKGGARITLSKADGTPPSPPGGSTVIARPRAPGAPVSIGRHGEGSRGGHIVGHTPGGKPIYAQQHVTADPQPGEQPHETHARLKQHLLDTMKAIHEHEQRHGMPSSFGGPKQLEGKAPGHTDANADTVIRGEFANKPKPGESLLDASRRIGPQKGLMDAARDVPALPPSGAPKPAAGDGTQPGRRMTDPKARGQDAPSSAPPSDLSEPAAGDIADSKKIAAAVAKDGYVGKTSTGKEVKLGGDTSSFTPAEMHEASQLHRAAQSHLLAAAKATGDSKLHAAARKHLDEEFKLTSAFVSHQGGAGLGPAMLKAEWRPLAAWGPMPFFRSARKLDRPAVTLEKAEYAPKGRIKLTPFQRSVLETHVEDVAHDEDEDRVKVRDLITGDHLTVHPGDDEGRSRLLRVLDAIAEDDDKATARAGVALIGKVNAVGTPKPKADPRAAAGKRAETLSSKAADLGAVASKSGKPEDHAAVAHAALAAANAHHDAGNHALAERVEATAQKHMASAGPVYIGPRGGKWRDAAHTQSAVEKKMEEIRARNARAIAAPIVDKKEGAAGFLKKGGQLQLLTLSKAFDGGERPGHKYVSRTPRPGGGFTYHYSAPWAPVHFASGEAGKVKKKRLLQGNLGVPRIQMPQIPAKEMDDFVAALREKGAHVTREQLPVGTLKATQSELHKKKIEEAVAGEEKAHLSKPVVVSSDGYLLDGHHRWAALATLDPNATINAVRVHLPIQQLLEHARNFQGASYKKSLFLESLPLLGTQVVTLSKASDALTGHAIQVGAHAGAPVTLHRFTMGRKTGEGSRGGHIIGHTKSGKPIYAKANGPMHSGFTAGEHEEAAAIHDKLKTPTSTQQAGIHRKIAKRLSPPKAPPAPPKVHELTRGESIAQFKEAAQHLQLLHGPTPLFDAHGQQQGEGAPLLKGSVLHHARIAHKFLAKHSASLEKETAKLRALAPKGARVDARVKSLPSALGKLAKKPKYGDVSKLQDGTGMRIVTDTIQNVRATVEKIKQQYKVLSEDDYISKPNGHGTDAGFGYRSHHLIVEGDDGLAKEIQVRTEGQDRHAVWGHDAYKPVTKEQDDALAKHGEATKQFAREASDWIFKKEQGLDPGPEPRAHPEVEKAFGRLDLG